MKGSVSQHCRVYACDDEDFVIEAWLTLMWRGYLFHCVNYFKYDFDGIYVPHVYYGSRLPGYLV